MENTELQYWVATTKDPKMGAIRFKRLYSFFPDMQTMWEKATISDLMEAGIEENIANEFVIRRKEIDPAAELQKMEKENIHAITIQDDNYPRLLKEIYNAPAVIFYKGNINELSDHALAIVGTRKMSFYGQQITENLIQELAPHNVTIVSGLALGIDTHAHLYALRHRLSTIAVLGSGLDRSSLYPSANRHLAEEIINNNGLILSEHPYGTMPLRHHFPLRNRIISGLSKATLVVEAGETSGALITAMYALEQNREVLAVPGSIMSATSQGTNKLIKQGAKTVTTVDDILEIYNLPEIKISREPIKGDNPIEEKVLAALTNEPIHIDLLAKKTGIANSDLSAAMTMMEIRGKVRNVGNMSFILGN
jgi:DNA processing protein